MKKLNNHGWGYKMMILLMTILIVFLFVAVYYIYKYYDTMKNTFYKNEPIYTEVI